LSLNDWLETFPDVIPEAECSKKHEKWKKNLFNKMRDDHYHRFTTRTIKVMLVAAILCALLLTAFVIPSSREFMLDKFDIASRYKITENNKNSVNGEITVEYIPEGFELDESIDLGKQIIYRYHNVNGDFFTIFKYASSIEVDFDTENYASEEVTFDSIDYVYCTGNNGMNSIVWNKNDYVYKIEASFEKEELIKIAKDVE
jgi:hypothetical protein